MVDSVFWDTHGFFAVLSSDDRAHQQASSLLKDFEAKKVRSVTSDWVIGETCTLLLMRKHAALIPKFLKILEQSKSFKQLHIEEDLFVASKKLFIQMLDHKLSFTDCTSIVLMKKLKLKKTVSGDRHFLVAGLEPLLA